MMKQSTKVKKRMKSQFLIAIGECDGKPSILNVNYIESIQHDGDEYVFTMKSGKVYRVAKVAALTNWLKPFIVGTSN